MAKSFGTLVDEMQQELQDTTPSIWQDTEAGKLLENALKEVSDYYCYIRRISYFIESRTGTATSDTASALVDSTESQFLSTDTGKTVYNKDDNTFTVVTAYVSASQLTLAQDIFPDGNEEYSIFNKGCSSNKQINIEDMTDSIGENHGVFKVEYPIGTGRNFSVDGDILTIRMDKEPDDSADDDAETEVYVWFKTRQRVSQLSDLAGAIDLGAGYAIGSTTIHVDALADESHKEGQLLTIAGISGEYMITTDVTAATNEADFVIYPGLLDAAEDGDVVTLIGSTLSSDLERIVVELAVARALMSKSIKHINVVNIGGGGVATAYHNIGRERLAIVLSELRGLRRMQFPRTKISYSKM